MIDEPTRADNAPRDENESITNRRFTAPDGRSLLAHYRVRSTTTTKTYQVYWFTVPSASVTLLGVCNCPDFYYTNTVRGDSAHECKHLRETIQQAVDALEEKQGARHAVARARRSQHFEKLARLQKAFIDEHGGLEGYIARYGGGPEHLGEGELSYQADQMTYDAYKALSALAELGE